MAADLAAGGLTFGAGALIGGIVGALGASGAAGAYNLARGVVDGKVGWSADFLAQRLGAALLRYLAVAHYGRGRGEWVEGEYPSHWRQLVHEVTQRHRGEAESVWSRADEGASVDEVARLLQPIIAATARETLVRLYPEAERVFESTPQSADRAVS